MALQLRSTEPLARQVRRAATDELWRRGILTWKLHADQREVYAFIRDGKASRVVLEIARRWGKTWLLALIAIETCLQNPGCRVVYGAPSLKHLAEFIIPTFEALCEDAPVDCRPRFNTSSGHWLFPNGAYVHLFGADDKRKADRGRGPAALKGIFDECGFTSVLRYALRSVIRPQLLSTRGTMLLGSTPAEEPDHDFTHIAEIAEANGTYVNRTIHDCPLYSDADIEKFIADDARDEGLSVEAYVESDDFRREYLAQRVINKLLIVVPEWEKAREHLIQRVERPEFFDGMTVLDPGGADPHAVTFGYWHFRMAKWVVEGELLLREGQNTTLLSEAVKAKERQLWGVDTWEGTLRGAREDPTQALLDNLPDYMREMLDKVAPHQPYHRWSDTNLQLVRDLYQLHKIAFIPTEKDDKQLQVNNLRVMISAGELLLSPDCPNTDRHMRTAVWENYKRKTFKRKGGEHSDLLDSLVYGARNLNKRNPYPKHWGLRQGEVQARARRQEDSLVKVLAGNNPLARKLLQSRKR